jgi:hypothetical protein
MAEQSDPSSTQGGNVRTWVDTRDENQVAIDHGYPSIWKLMCDHGLWPTTPKNILQAKEVINSLRKMDAEAAAARLAAEAGRLEREASDVRIAAEAARMAARDGRWDGKAANAATTEKAESTSGPTNTQSSTQPSSRASSDGTTAVAGTLEDGEVDDAHERVLNGIAETANETRGQIKQVHEEARGSREQPYKSDIDNIVYGQRRLRYMESNLGDMGWEYLEEEEEEERDDEEGEGEENDGLYFEGGSYDERANCYWDEQDW